MAAQIIEYEKVVHLQDEMSVMKCIRETLDNDELKPWIKEQCQGANDTDCLKEKCGFDKHSHYGIVATIFIETILMSLIPYSMDQVSDISLYLKYRSENDSNSNHADIGHNTQGGTLSGDVILEGYDMAELITLIILCMNALVYTSGIIISQPTWITAKIKEEQVKIERIKFLQELKIEIGYQSDDLKQELDNLLTDKYLQPRVILLTIFSLIARIFWPILILIPHNYINMSSTVPSDMSQEKYQTENLWVFLKVAESSMENVVHNKQRVVTNVG